MSLSPAYKKSWQPPRFPFVNFACGLCIPSECIYRHSQNATTRTFLPLWRRQAGHSSVGILWSKRRWQELIATPRLRYQLHVSDHRHKSVPVRVTTTRPENSPLLSFAANTSETLQALIKAASPAHWPAAVSLELYSPATSAIESDAATPSCLLVSGGSSELLYKFRRILSVNWLWEDF